MTTTTYGPIRFDGVSRLQYAPCRGGAGRATMFAGVLIRFKGSPSMVRPILCGLALLAAVASLGFAPAPFPKKNKADARYAEALYGDWHNPKQPRVVVSISATEFAYINSGVRNNVYRLTLDVKKNPMWYDIRQGSRAFVGLIKVEGDTLTVKYNIEQKGVARGGRPMSFDGPGHVEVYYRVKKR
jgi:hypothetical protein